MGGRGWVSKDMGSTRACLVLGFRKGQLSACRTREDALLAEPDGRVTLSKVPDFSKPQFPHLEKEIIIIPP